MFARPDNRLNAAVALLVLALLSGGCSGAGDAPADADATPRAEAGSAAPDDAPAAPAAAGATDRPVDAETLPYAEVNDQLVYGYFAFPSDMIEPLPAILVIHDWWGLNDDVRNAANRLASQGYIVLAVDLYAGTVVVDAVAARQRMISVMDNPDDVQSNLRQALDFLRVAGAPQAATLGWGFGGSWSLNAATLFPAEIDAAIVYYGQVPGDDERMRPIDAPLLGLFGANDRVVTAESVREFEAALKRLRKSYSIHVYPEAGHAFADPARRNFDPQLAEDAWRRVTVFLAETLSAGESS